MTSRPTGGIGVAPPPLPARDPGDVLGDKLVRSLGIIRHLQHPNGEILSYRRDERGNHVYCRSPFASAFVHDALACFDPWAVTDEAEGLALIPEAMRRPCGRLVTEIRSRIRSFLIWQQEPEGYWRFFGRGSGIDPDVNTTAWAALACQESYGTRSLMRWQRQIDVIDRFRSPDGRYYTFLKPGRGGYGWLDAHGYPVVGHDRVVNAEVLRFLLLTGDTGRGRVLGERLLDEATRADLDTGTPLYPGPLAFAFALARAWHEGGLGKWEVVSSLLVPLVRRIEESGGLDSPLAAALAAASLWYLGVDDAEFETARRGVLRGLQPGGGWRYGDLVIHGFGSPAVTTALSMWVLARPAPSSRGLRP